MKKLISLVVMVLMSISYTGFSANAEVKREDKVFYQVSNKTKDPGKDTGFIWKDKKGNSYPIIMSKSGACYVIRVSQKTGNPYKYYLGKEISIEICKELNVKYTNNK